MPAQTVTCAQGRFEIKELPAGRYTMSASKGGFVSLQYGQRRPSESGTPIELGDSVVTSGHDKQALARVSDQIVVAGFSGVVEYLSQRPYDALLRVDQPAPGVAALGTVDFGGQVMVALAFYLYGDGAAAAVARETPLWQAWIEQRFAAPAAPGPST